MIYVIGPGHGGPAAGRERLAGGHLQRGLPGRSRRTRRACGGCSRQFSFPGGIPSHVAPETPGLDPRGRRARLRPVARLRRRVRQPGPGRRRASSATARPRPARWPPAGTPTSSSTRRATAPCCRSCTSTATRSPTRRCWPASRDEELDALLRGYGYTPYLVEGDDPADDAPAVRRHPRPLPRRDRRASSAAAREDGEHRAAAAGR